MIHILSLPTVDGVINENSSKKWTKNQLSYVAAISIDKVSLPLNDTVLVTVKDVAVKDAGGR